MNKYYIRINDQSCSEAVDSHYPGGYSNKKEAIQDATRLLNEEPGVKHVEIFRIQPVVIWEKEKYENK